MVLGLAHDAERADGAERSQGEAGFGGLENGAEGQDRTADTTIFNRVLYQLSYLGTRAPDEPSGTSEVYKTAGE
jgi:hypothetical protein